MCWENPRAAGYCHEGHPSYLSDANDCGCREAIRRSFDLYFLLPPRRLAAWMQAEPWRYVSTMLYSLTTLFQCSTTSSGHINLFLLKAIVYPSRIECKDLLSFCNRASLYVEQ